MKKFLRRLGKMRVMIFCFVVLCAASYCFNGWLGLLSAMFGWWLGSVIYDWKENKRRLKRFLQRLSDLQLELLVKGSICLPIVAASIYYNGWLGLAASVVGIAVGEFICRRWLFKKR